MDTANVILEYLRVLIWPTIILSIFLIFKRHLVILLDRIYHAELPGGVAVDLTRKIEETKELSTLVRKAEAPPNKNRGPAIPLTEANARLLQLGFRASPSGLDVSYYRNLAEEDPNVALAGLRIEVDILARNLAKGFNFEIAERDSGARLVRRLYDEGAITLEQMRLTLRVLQVCNAAVHGSSVSYENAISVIDSAGILFDQYLSWLSWGFKDDWTPTTN